MKGSPAVGMSLFYPKEVQWATVKTGKRYPLLGKSVVVNEVLWKKAWRIFEKQRFCKWEERGIAFIFLATIQGKKQNGSGSGVSALQTRENPRIVGGKSTIFPSKRRKKS